MSNALFSSLDLSSKQIANLASLGYEAMTEVQEKSLPSVLNGQDVVVQAKTGSGKTVAFGLGLLQQINPRFFGAQSLVLCPTRELADQVAKELRKLARCVDNIKVVVLVGGKPFGPQKGSLEHGGHIIVGTPGRVQDHLNRGTLNLQGLKILVLDEADRMLDMGFSDVVTEIIEQTPDARQTLLFSATYPSSVNKMCRAIQDNPVTIKIETNEDDNTIEQHFYQMEKNDRDEALIHLFQHHKPKTALVFCHTKKSCADIAKFLSENNIQSLAIHGDLEQPERDQVLAQFANNSCPVLVATDVAARGLDIKSLEAVVNYELPRDLETYTHRIGRTGRAGAKGLALSLYAPYEQHRVDAIEEVQPSSCVNQSADELEQDVWFKLYAPMVTLQLDAGRKNKLRPGDLLGALTGDAGLDGANIGKIDIFDRTTYVAIERSVSDQAVDYFSSGKVKGRHVRARKIWS